MNKEITTEKLITDNMTLVYFLINKHYPTFIHDEDVIQSGMLGLVEAANKFDPEKGKFSSFASVSILNSIIQYFRSQMKQNNQVSINNMIDDELEYIDLLVGEDDIVGDVSIFNVSDFINTLDPQEKQIIKMIGLGYSKNDIADILDCSIQRVYTVHRLIKIKWEEYNK